MPRSVAVRSVSTPASSASRRKYGEFPRRPSRAATWAGVADGLLCRYAAAAPATCGAAIDVPLIDVTVALEPIQDDMMLWPGAKTSTHVPQLENDARVSVFVVAPTVMASPTRDGEP